MISFDTSGLVAPVFTPMHEDFTINFSIIPSYLKLLHDVGIYAVLIAGTSGEVTCLNVNERKTLAEAWIETAGAHPRQTQVIVQVGGAPYPDVLELAKHAQEIKADAILTLPELYFKPKTAEELVVYLQDISKAAANLPLLYYHFPMLSGVNVDMKKLFALASSSIPNFVGVKGDIDIAVQVSEYIKNGKKVFIGNHLLAPAARLGINDSIATVTNIFPEIMKGILEAVKMNHTEKSTKLQMKLNVLVDAITSQGDWVPSMKYAMELVTGLKVGPTRKPITPLTRIQKASLENNLRNNQIDLKMN